MKEIKLTKGKVALVDDEDFEYLNQWKWRALKGSSTYYASMQTNTRDEYGVYKQKITYMHRLLMNCSAVLHVDHMDHNGLNNQRSNLRNCTRGENQRNKRASGKSKYLGVTVIDSWFGRKNKSGVRKKHFTTLKYVAHIMHNRKIEYLGRYNSEVDAAIAYNKAAVKYHKEFANLNIIP